MAAQESRYVNTLTVLSKLKLALVLIASILLTGVIGFSYIEGWPILDSFYMTLITITTVGFDEVRPLSASGKLFTIFLIIAGVGTVLYAFSLIVEFFIEGHLGGLMGERKMKKRIDALDSHYILCGLGRVGQQVAKEFLNLKIPFVVIDRDHGSIENFRSQDLLFIEGDATEDRILEEAGITRATGLIAALNDDADNVYVVLTSKSFNQDLFIVARSSSEGSELKLKKAGATKVISPAVIGGRRMASYITRPVACDYLDIITQGQNIEFQLAEFKVDVNSQVANKAINELDIRGKTLGAMILAINQGENFNTNPMPSTKIQSGDVLIAIGTNQQLELFKKLI
ncbi:MAG: potassium channel protein [Actinomycetota bacterium]|nr:potassium channel protein [Actinomycetota bacterium]